MFGKMVSRIKKAMKAAQRPQFEQFNPAARFADELAGRIEWTPAAPGGSSFGTHRLVEVRPDRMEFKPSAGLYAFFGIFAAAGVVVLGVFAFGLLGSGSGGPAFGGETGVMIFLLLFGAVFAGSGIAMMCLMGRPRVFDLAGGCYWKGRRRPASSGSADSVETEPNPYQQPLVRPSRAQAATDPGKKPRVVAISDVHAIQLIRERCSGDDSSYWSYELNMVLQDGRRVNVVDHGNLKRIKADARNLAAFLGVPLWDAASEA